MYEPSRGILSAPAVGLDEVHREIADLRFDRIRGHWTRSFRATPEIQEWTSALLSQCHSDNGIFSLRTPGMRRVEGDIVGWALDLMSAPPAASGNLTSGGSESIYCAMHAARNWAREVRPEIERPTVIVPHTAHPAFSKACEYLDMAVRRIPIGPDRRADVTATVAAIDEDAICLVGSAPCWPFALIDPIEELASVAAEHGLWMHVDACVGGYLLPFVEMLTGDIVAWDFRIAGVRSISADLHKYAYTPKPCSTVLWRDRDDLRFHLVRVTDALSGPYQTTAMAGTRAEGAVFTAWAMIRHLGRAGYLDLTRGLLELESTFVDAIAAIDGLFVPEHDLLPLPVGATDGGLPAIQAAMAARGWTLLGIPDPPLITLPIDPAAAGEVAETFLDDLRDVAAAKARGQLEETGDLSYG